MVECRFFVVVLRRTYHRDGDKMNDENMRTVTGVLSGVLDFEVNFKDHCFLRYGSP